MTFAQPPPGFRVVMANDEAMGRWASSVELNVDRDSFTLDFFRIDAPRTTAILVARVTLSAMVASALAETLEGGLSQHAASLVESATKPLAFGDEGGDNASDGSHLPDV